MAIHIKAKNKGKLHQKLGVSQSKPLPLSSLLHAKHSSSMAERKEANFAINARKWNHS